MNIKKVDNKPMVIHTKEKAKLHIKQEPEAKIKGRNILVVERTLKIAGANTEDVADIYIVQHYMQDYPKEKIRKLSGILALDRN